MSASSFSLDAQAAIADQILIDMLQVIADYAPPKSSKKAEKEKEKEKEKEPPQLPILRTRIASILSSLARVVRTG